MTLSARAIAVQGIGYSPLLVGLQGLLGVEQEQESSGGVWPGLGAFRREQAEIAARRTTRRTDDAARAVDVVPIAPDGGVDQRFSAAELQAAIEQLSSARGFLPRTIKLPGRTIDTEAATDDDMALIAFALFMAMED